MWRWVFGTELIVLVFLNLDFLLPEVDGPENINAESIYVFYDCFDAVFEYGAGALQITDTVRVSEVAFTGDTTPDFILDDANIDALQAKLLIMEVCVL